jgi:formate dehydrogenase
MTATQGADAWHKTVCILCSANCGVELRLDGREITRVRGNKSHVASLGYTCEKALRLNHYQNGMKRLQSPMRREADGTYTAVDWDTAIREVAAGLTAVGAQHGKDKVMYYGGGGQGNHMVGVYGSGTRRALGITVRSNALAQEKTGEAWVEGHLTGAHTHGDFHHAEVSIFLGKNPWHSHGFNEARRVLKDISKDPERSMIVIDPRRSETADLADFHLAVKPGTDAFCVAALLGVIVQEDLVNHAWLKEHANGTERVLAELAKVDVADFSARCGIAEADIRAAARRIGTAKGGVSIYEDLGIEMAPNSTLVSYLQRLIWILVGSFNVPGGTTTHSGMAPLFSYGATGNEPTTPVTGGKVISGLVPCNEIPDMILTDHPDRIRGMFVESANPVHSLAQSPRWREAMRALDFSVVIDVAMTETAREASYVLPASSQYEKCEATFFGASFPENHFTVRAPIFEPLEGTLPEAEIHARLARELGLLDDDVLDELRAAAHRGLKDFGAALLGAASSHPEMAGIGPVVMYLTLGQTLPEGMADAAPVWFSAQQCAMRYTDAVKAAGFEDIADEDLGDALFEAIIASRDGVMITKHTYDQGWSMVRTADGKVNAEIPELLDDLAALAAAPTDHRSAEFPFILSAGERRAFTANTIMRDSTWRKKDPAGALRLSPADALALGVESGDKIRITTHGGSAVAPVEVNDTMQDGHISIPNGMGLYAEADSDSEVVGIPPNELTSLDWKDQYAGTPWHKHVPAKLEPVPA